jgi:multidrug efflux pump subunit AcrB
MIRKLIAWVLDNHLPITLTLGCLLIIGIYSFISMPKDVYPESQFPRFHVIVDVGFASMQETELNITRPLEEAFKTVPGVLEVRSVTEQGTSTIDVFLRWGANIKESFQYIQTKTGELRGRFPADADIQIMRMNTSSSYQMSEYGIWSDSLGLKELYTLTRYNIIPQLIGVEGIYDLRVIGGEQPEIWVKLDAKKMLYFNIDPKQVGDAIDKANKPDFIGKVMQDKQILLGFSGSQITNFNQLRNVVVVTRMNNPVNLKDIAVIDDFHEDIRRIISVNGHKGLIIDVRKQENVDGLRLSKDIDFRFSEIQRQLVGRLHIVKWDLSSFVSDSLASVLRDIALGALAIIVIVWYFFGGLRFAMPVILLLPVLIIVEFIVLKVSGMSINIMTLGGFAAALGIIGDNAIVITENFIRHRAQKGHVNALVDSVENILAPMLAATFVTIIVFVPLVMLSGVPGMFFKPMVFTLGSSVVLSLFAAIFITPVLIKYFSGKTGDTVALGHGEERGMMALLKRAYLKSLRFSLKLRYAIVASAVLAIAAAILLFAKIPTGFIPESDEGKIMFDYIAQQGLSIASVDSILVKVEDVVRQIPEVELFVRKTGTASAFPYMSPNNGEIVVALKKKRTKSVFEIIDEMREKVTKAVPDLDVDFHQILPDRLGDLTGTRKPILVNIIGNNLEEIRHVAGDVKSKLEGVHGLNDVLIDLPPPQKVIKTSINTNNASLLGLTPDDVAQYAKIALYGAVVSEIPRGLQMVPIRQIFDGGNERNVESLSKVPLYTPNGGIIPLGKLASFSVVDQYPEIHHQNGSLVVSVSAEISNRALGEVVKDVQEQLSRITSPNVIIELSGDYQNQQKSFKQLLFVLFTGIILILLTLLFLFDSLPPAFAVFFGTIASGTFVIFGLILTHTAFDVSSFTGLISVMGIVVNNGILVIEFADRFRKQGRTVIQAIEDAGSIRLRPVLITNLVTIAGFLPIALSVGGGGAEILRPFAIAVISGLVGSILFSLILMPVFYYIFHHKK